MDKTKIDWCDSTWNPVTGCLHGCEYCYARGIARRFAGFEPRCGGEEIPEGKGTCPKSIYTSTHGEGLHVFNEQPKKRIQTGEWQKAPYPYSFEPTLHKYRFEEYQNKKARNIFVCSMADLFGSWVPDSWIEEVFDACDKALQYNYLFLSKNPIRYASAIWNNEKDYIEDHMSNMWFGTSITKESEMHLFNYLPAFCNTFVSIEPILEDLQVEKHNVMFRQVDWFIIGAETGRRKDKVIPKREWIEDIVNECRKSGKPVFMKSSLAEIWGEPLVQEFPKQLAK